jgi:hypothetical protein
MTNFGRDLGNESTQTPDERRAEADRILKILIETDLDIETLNVSERRFVSQQLDDQTVPISPKQLFWLRDIKAKYCE